MNRRGNYFLYETFFFLFQVFLNVLIHLGYFGNELNLSCIPPSIPSSIQTLDFSCNVLKHLQKTVFPVPLQELELRRKR
uniref:Uncharacterized protein n=1 Tax=Sinocyclocheilus rhinocerous TaxID=307959 RepID=A0A673JBT7_9TELE